MFHDREGNPIATTVTGADGTARHLLDAQGAVTVIEVDQSFDRRIVTAQDVPPGANVVLHGGGVFNDEPEPEDGSFTIRPRVPEYPAGSENTATYLYVICGTELYNLGDASPSAEIPTRCLDSDGKYTLEAIVVLVAVDNELTLLATSRLEDIPAGDLDPVLPEWLVDPPTIQRVSARHRLWTFYESLVLDAKGRVTVSIPETTSSYTYWQTGPAAAEVVYRFEAAGTHFERVAAFRHEVAPLAPVSVIDGEADRLRAPLAVYQDLGRATPEVSWTESEVGLAPRFALAAIEWHLGSASTEARPANGRWILVRPAGERRAVFPTLPPNLEGHLPPPDERNGHTYPDVTLLDDTGASSYADLLALDPLSSPWRSRGRAYTIRTASQGRPFLAPAIRSGATITLSTSPAATAGRVHVAVGVPLTLNAHVSGITDGGVLWSSAILPGCPIPTVCIDGADFHDDGATGTLTGKIAGAVYVIAASSAAAPDAVAQVIVEIDPPPCLQPFPVLYTPRPQAQIRSGEDVALAVRRDGRPVVAVTTEEASLYPLPGNVDVVGWNGAFWVPVAPPLALAEVPNTSLVATAFAMTIDADDQPVIAYRAAPHTIEVVHLKDGGWEPLTDALDDVAAGNVVLALDGAGDPVLARSFDAPSGHRQVWVARWKQGRWAQDLALDVAGSDDGATVVRGLAMDGDLPVVLLQGQRSMRIIKVDRQGLDLGSPDDDLSYADYPSPRLLSRRVAPLLVSWVDPHSDLFDAPLEVKVSAWALSGWVTAGTSAPIPDDPGFSDRISQGMAADPEGRVLLVAQGERRGVAALYELGAPTAPVCVPFGDLDFNEQWSSVWGIAVAADPTGGFIVALANGGVEFDNGGTHISVARIWPW